MKNLWIILLPAVMIMSCNTREDTTVNPGIVYPKDARAVIDMTQPPYNLDNTGEEDCSDALIRALDDMLRPTRDRQKEIEQLLRENPDTVIGFEINAERGVIFPDKLEPSKIFYFPDGTYKISKTIEYTLEDLQNQRGAELNRQIHFQGQSEEGTVFKLVDHAPGFNTGTPRPVINFMKGAHSNIAMSNTFEHITIDVGTGNPDAIGLHYFANNTGAVRNVTIRSSDPEGKGSTGLAILRKPVSGCVLKDISIEGFDTGIEVTEYGIFSVFEHIELSNQRKYGFHVIDNVVSIRNLQSQNKVPAVALTGEYGHVVILDSELTGGNSTHPAIEQSDGVLFARNVKTEGYQQAIQSHQKDVPESHVGEYSSHGVYTLFGDSVVQTLNLPVEETPYPEWPASMDDWACVNDFGAKGDGQHDDTQAIQEAMRSGKKVIYFQPGKYVVDSTIVVPATVERINFMYTDLIAGEHLKTMKGQGAFSVQGENDVPLLIEDLFAWEAWLGSHFLIDHASTRTVILSDLHTQVGSMYFNSVKGGKVFIENVCTTDEYPKRKCFVFNEQQVWARQINPERSDPEIVNNGSDLWIMGFKFESNGTGILTKNGGRTEVLGGVINTYGSAMAPDKSALIVENATMSFISANRGPETQKFNIIVKETQDGETRYFHHADMLHRKGNNIFIPLYQSKRGE